MTKTLIKQTELDVPRKVTVYTQATGTNYTTTSTSAVDVGVSTTYTAGNVDEQVTLTINILILSSASATYVVPNIDGVDHVDRLYNNSVNNWLQCTKSYVFNVDANDTVTVKLRWWVGSGTGTISRSHQYHTPHFIFTSRPRI